MASPCMAQVEDVEIVGRPLTNDDQVTLRVKVSGAGQRPVTGLQGSDFQISVDGETIEFDPRNWKSPQEATPPPAWIVVLLDLSGSMRKPDPSGVTKLEGAVEAIQQFTSVIGSRARDTQVSIVPFGHPNPDPKIQCKGYPVTSDAINNFFPAEDAKLGILLSSLKANQAAVCGSTDLYTPLITALDYFTNPEDPRFQIPEDGSQPEPRLSIILLSDGYHVKKEIIEKKSAFDTIRTLLDKNQNSTITVHTLGYGITPEALGKRYLGRPATVEDVCPQSAGDKTVEEFKAFCPGKVPSEEFVDRATLKEIALLTNGISDFSGNPNDIADNLKVFLESILGAYEITYTEPNPDRDLKHDVTVAVTKDEAVVESEAKPYKMQGFGRAVPLKPRLILLSILVGVFLFGGLLPFWMWAESLKRQM